MSRRHRLLAALAAAGAVMLLAACAGAPDPEVVRESLSEVTEEAPVPEAVDELSQSANPDPIVDPLECTPYLAITARGTGEPTRGQLLSPVARAISEARPGSVQTVDIDYPADTDVKAGGTLGVRWLIDTLNLQAEECPEQYFIVLGYSQGALIVGDALSEPDVRLVGAAAGELSPDAADRILAIVLYGDPRFLGSEPYNSGTFDERRNGILPRPAGSLSEFADRLRDYCLGRDFICQSSLDLDEQGHIGYYDNGMQQDGAAFVITRLPPLVDEDAAFRPDADADANEGADG